MSILETRVRNRNNTYYHLCIYFLSNIKWVLYTSNWNQYFEGIYVVSFIKWGKSSWHYIFINSF